MKTNNSVRDDSSHIKATSNTSRSLAPLNLDKSNKTNPNYDEKLAKLPKTQKNRDNPQRAGVSFFDTQPIDTLDSPKESSDGGPLQNSKIQNRFRNMVDGPEGMYRTQNHIVTVTSPIVEMTTDSKVSSRQAPHIGTPKTPQTATLKNASVHERRCKVEDNDETTLLSRDGNRIGTQNSRGSEIRSRISGKETGDQK